MRGYKINNTKIHLYIMVAFLELVLTMVEQKKIVETPVTD